MDRNWIIDKSDLVLVTGANGFVGRKVCEILTEYGFRKFRFFIRSNRNLSNLESMVQASEAEAEFVEGNLLSREDCFRAAEGVSLIFHLAAGTGKSFADCFMNSAVSTRNLLDAALDRACLKRFLNVSSLCVYSGFSMRPNQALIEESPVEKDHMARFDPYCYGKIKQDEIVMKYGKEFGVPFAIVRPGPVYGPGKKALNGRVGIDIFGIFLHIGGSNSLPVIFLDNCAEAIVRAGIVAGVDGEVFIAVDDDLPTSRDFLRLYKKNVANLWSIRIPYPAFYYMTCLWEKYSNWSEGQLPPVFNRRNCAAYYQKQHYSNRKLKEMTGWTPRMSFQEALQRYFDFMNA
jgi:nucleoside-diphosphate-sugar epimerase